MKTETKQVLGPLKTAQSVKGLAQASGSKFAPQNPQKKNQGAVTYTCNPSVEEAETGSLQTGPHSLISEL